MIAYYFPPVGGIGAAGAQRTLKFAKYLPDYGWKPTVLTVKTSQYESYLALDSTLLNRVDPRTLIVRTSVIRWLTAVLKAKHWVLNRVCTDTRATQTEELRSGSLAVSIRSQAWYARMKDAITDLFEIPDEEIGWSVPAIIAGLRAIKVDSIEAIFSTGRPWTSHLIGIALKRLTGARLVVDFRDPWITNPFRLQYSQFRSRAEKYLEAKVIEEADLVIANTRELAEEFKARYAFQPKTKFLSLLNGFDPADYGRAHPESAPASTFTIIHTGFLYGQRDPKSFLDAVRMVLDENRIPRETLKVLFVGNVELPYNLANYVKDLGLSDVVSLYPQISYQESLGYLQKASAALLLQPGTKTQVPSKLFDYIGAAKPVLAISPRGGATYNLVDSEKLGELAEPESRNQIAMGLERLYSRWVISRESLSISPSIQHKFDIRHLTKSLASELQALSLR